LEIENSKKFAENETSRELPVTKKFRNDNDYKFIYFTFMTFESISPAATAFHSSQEAGFCWEVEEGGEM
jgi:hypothetical protein